MRSSSLLCPPYLLKVVKLEWRTKTIDVLRMRAKSVKSEDERGKITGVGVGKSRGSRGRSRRSRTSPQGGQGAEDSSSGADKIGRGRGRRCRSRRSLRGRPP